MADHCHEGVIAKAAGLVRSDRQEDYGHPLDNLATTGRLWAAILGVAHITAEQVALCQVATKLARQAHRHKEDNLVDIVGYVSCYEAILKERERREMEM